MFHERLVEIRKSQGITQKQVADALGIKEQTYQRHEYGKNELKELTIIKLCNYFNVSADYLLGLSDDPEKR